MIEISKELHKSVHEIITQRSKIIEDYIKFWFAVKVRDEKLTAEAIASDFVLCMRNEGLTIRYWLEPKKLD